MKKKPSTQSIQVVESILVVTPSPDAPKFYEISDILSYHIVDSKEYIQISVVEEKLSFHSTRSFSSDSYILNYVQSFPVKDHGDEEKSDSSISNHVVGVHKSHTLYFLEEVSYFRSDTLTLIDLGLPTNSYMISCTNTLSFVEEG